MKEIAQIAKDVAEPTVLQLGMVGIVTVITICIFASLFWFTFKHLTNIHKSERDEWRQADRDARNETNKVLSDLKDVIRISNSLRN